MKEPFCQKKKEMSLPASALASNQHSVSDLKRPFAKYTPSIWGDFFLQYASESMEVNDNLTQQAQNLKEEVKMIFQSSVYQNINKKLNFIDLVQRFGVSYHFQREIDQALEQINNTFAENNNIGEEVYHNSLALLFRLLRRQGYRISSSWFSKLKNDKGNFNEILANDVQGLCNLYEAAHLRTHEDDILEEAYDFSNTQLKFMANQLSPSVVTQINHCLRLPLYKSVPRFDARYHMALYEQDPSHNETLLTFAKVDFNILQKLHQKEIGNITKWWKKSNFATKVPYARDRLVEGYLWTLALTSKPEHSKGRMYVGKFFAIFSLVDDTYDAYGTVQELEVLTEAMRRWDISLIGSLPECMKAVFDAVVELCEDVDLLTIKSGKSSFVVSYVKQAVYDLIRGYMIEAKWCQEGYIPTYDEYKVNGILTSGLQVIITMFIALEGEFTTEDVFKWIFTYPNIIQSSSIVDRLLDDIGTHKFEQQREHVASAIECCMKQYGITEAEAYDLIYKDVEDCWKVINEECLNLDDIPKFVLDVLVNLSRSFEFIYENHDDKFTNIELLKDYVSSQLLEPM